MAFGVSGQRINQSFTQTNGVKVIINVEDIAVVYPRGSGSTLALGPSLHTIDVTESRNTIASTSGGLLQAVTETLSGYTVTETRQVLVSLQHIATVKELTPTVCRIALRNPTMSLNVVGSFATISAIVTRNIGTQFTGVVTDSTLTGDGAGTDTLKIAQQGATSGQVLKWDGATWSPANDSVGGGSGSGHVLANAGSAVAQKDTADFLDMGDIDFTLTNTSTKSTIVADIRPNVIDSSNIASGALSVTDLGQHSATSGQVLKWNGTQWAPSSDSTGSGTYIRYQYESAITDTIPVPIGAKTVSVVLVGAGGGGGSGRRGAAGTNRGGGGGGGGGAVTVGDFDLSDIGNPSSLVLNCGTGGAGGAARTSDDTNGAAGSNGGTTSLTTLSGGVIAHALGGYAGSGGTTSGGGGGAGGGYGMFAGPSGGSGGNPGGFSVGPCSGGGGGGGGITGGNLGATGGAGGGGWYFIAVGASGGTPGVAGTNSSDPGIGRWGTNGAGGGGSSGTDGIAGGAGGNGTHGAGGGGGAASRNNNNSGAGGTGGDGYAIVMFTMTDDTIGMFSAGTGISIDTNYVITNTGDTNASDDLTTATSFSGDVSGTYNNLQIGAGAVGNTELASTAVDSTKVPVGALSVTDLGQHGASSGEVLKWNGTQWAPDADTGGSGSDVGIVNAADYGAVGDGVTDDTDSLQAAIDAAAGKRLWIPAGRYITSSELTVASNTEITMSDSAIIDISDWAPAVSLGGSRAFNISGTSGTSTSVGSDIALNAYDITVSSTTGFSDGDMVEITSTEPLFAGYSNRYKGWVTIVDSVLSGTVIRIANNSPFAIDAVGGSYTATFKRFNPVKNVTIRGGKIVGGGFEKGHTGIYTSIYKNLTIDRVVIDSCEASGVWLGTGIQGLVSRCQIMNATSPEYIGGLGYGVLIGSGYGTVISNNYFERCRHSVASGGTPTPFNAIIKDNYSYNCGLGTPDYDCHGATIGFVFENNTTHAGPNGRGGFVIRSIDAVLKGNHVYGGAIAISNADGITPGSTGPLGRITLSDNVVKNNTSGYGIEIANGGESYLSITGGSIENCSLGIKISGATSQVKIGGVSFVDIANEAIQADDCDGLAITNCTFDDVKAAASILSTSSDVVISNCVATNCTDNFVGTYLTDNVYISNCIASGMTNSSGIYFNRSNNCRVDNCYISMNNASFDGIRAWGSTATAHNISATNNKVFGSYRYGLYAYSNSDTITAIGNDFRAAVTAQIYTPDATVVQIWGNVAQATDHGDISVSGSGPGLNIDANVVDSTNVCTGCISVTDLGQHGASTNDFLTWNGTQWRAQTNSDLVAVEGLSGTGIAVRTASNTWTNRTITAGTGISVSNGNGVSGNPTVSADTSLLATVNDLNIAATQVAFGSASGSITGSNNFWYNGPTLTLNSTSDDTLLVLTKNNLNPFGIQQFTDPYNGSTIAYRWGGFDGRRIFMTGYGFYPEAPFYQQETAGIGFSGSTGALRLHLNGDYYTATTTGDNATTNRNVSFYFESGGATTGYGNPVIFQNIFSNNDSTSNGYEFISRNTASGGVTIADSTLMRMTSWDRGVQFNLTQRGRLGLQTRSPLYSLDINDTDGIRVPRGTTAQRPAGTPAGVIRFNTDSIALEVGTGSGWTTLGSGGAGGGVSDGDKGDITVSSSGTVWDIDAGVVGNTEIGSGAGGIFKGDGTLPAGTTNATLPSSGILRVEYNGGNAGLIVDDANSASSILSKDGTQFVSSDNTQVLIGSGTSKMEYIDGVLRVYDSDASQYVAIQTPATGSLTSNYTLTLPVDDGTSGQYLQTDGSGGLSWQTVSGAGDILDGGNTTGATVTIGTNDAQSLELETNGTTFMTANSSGNVGLGSTPGGMRLAINLTDASTSGTPIALQSKLTLSPGSNSSISSRSLNMANYFDAAGINFTGNPQAAWFENRVINAGDFTGHLYGIFTSGLLMGGDAVSIGTVTNASGISLTPVSSFSNSVSGTVTNARGGYVRNAGKGSLTITNQAGINIEALSAATNNTSILLGTTTIPSGNYGIYSTVTDSSIFSGPMKAYGLIATATFAATNTITDRLLLQTNTSGSVGAGQGGGILFQGESSTNENQDQARIAASWTTTTHTSREAKVGIQLGDNGGALAEIANFNVSGNNAGQLSIGSSTPVTIQNSGITTAASFTVGNSSSSLTLGGSSGSVTVSSSSSSGITINASSNTTSAAIILGTSSFSTTSGTKEGIYSSYDFAPTSGTGRFNAYSWDGTVNQTGGANGPVSAFYVNPTLTAVADFRGIELPYSNSAAKGIYQTGSSTTNNFVGKTRFGGTTTPDDAVEVEGNIELVTAGNKIKIATGSNASAGVSGAMTAGSITISTTAVTANSLIFLTHATVGGTQGILSVGTITAGTSFVINSSSASDTGTVNWLIIN